MNIKFLSDMLGIKISNLLLIEIYITCAVEIAIRLDDGQGNIR